MTDQKRLMTKKEAARYCSLSSSGFDEWVRRGIMPEAIRGTNRWDKIAIDIRLNELSGIPTPPGATASELDEFLKN